MKIHYGHNKGTLSFTWYNKPPDTDLIMNYHALAPKCYKRSVVSVFVYRIYRAYSSWEKLPPKHGESQEDPGEEPISPTFYEPVIRQALSDILGQLKSRITHQSTTNRLMKVLEKKGLTGLEKFHDN